MPTYVRLIRLTDVGKGSLSEKFAEAKQIFAENGGRVVSVWSTLGSYDVVGVVEAPDDATMMKISAKIAPLGVVAESMPATPMEEFLKSVG